MSKHDLLIFPCSASKKGSDLRREIPTAAITDFISHETAEILSSAQARLSRDPRDEIWFDRRTRLSPGLALYTGNQYKVPNFRERILDAILAGTHCLILSGGYGLIRAEEPIHLYAAEITQTRKYWADVIPEVLSEYIQRNDIRRVFIGCSSSYSAILKKKGWAGKAVVYWCIPKLRRGEGGAMVKVPKLTGEAIVNLIDDRFDPGRAWKTTWPK